MKTSTNEPKFMSEAQVSTDDLVRAIENAFKRKQGRQLGKPREYQEDAFDVTTIAHTLVYRSVDLLCEKVDSEDARTRVLVALVQGVLIYIKEHSEDIKTNPENVAHILAPALWRMVPIRAKGFLRILCVYMTDFEKDMKEVSKTIPKSRVLH